VIALRERQSRGERCRDQRAESQTREQRAEQRAVANAESEQTIYTVKQRQC
jgi:hypothetical protein